MKIKNSTAHKEKFDKSKMGIVVLLSFLMGFGQALIIYVMSSYLKLASGSENVGLFYFLAYAIELIILLNFHKIVSTYGRAQAFLIGLAVKIPIVLALVLIDPSLLGIFFIVLYIIIGSLIWVALDVILEYCSMDRLSGRIRGFHLTVLNVGFIAGPFISTRILDSFGYQGIFCALVVLYSFMLIVALFGLRGIKEQVRERSSVKELILKAVKRRNVMKAYYISFVLDFFYALIVIYTPIYLINLGVEWSQIGIIFTIMLIPFALLQFPAGFLADKKFGEKELLVASIFIMGIATMIIFFITSTSVVIWSLVLFTTRIGASLVEILRDSYFYKRIDSYDIDLIDFFRTSRPVAFMISGILSTFLLFLLPLKFVFVLVSVVVLSALIPAFRLVDNKSEREMKANLG